MVEQYGELDATIVTDGTKGMVSDSTVLINNHGGSEGPRFGNIFRKYFLLFLQHHLSKDYIIK